MLSFFINHKNAISLIIGVLLSSAALYLAFRNVPFNDLANYFTTIQFVWILPALAASIVSLVLRVVRWQIIVGTIRKLTFWQAFHPVMIGFMVNCVLPGRVGEFARPAVLKSKVSVAFTTGLATVIMERIFDFIILITIFTVMMATVSIDPDFSMSFGTYTLGREALDTVFHGMVQFGSVLIVGIILITFDTTRSMIAHGVNLLPVVFFFTGTSFKVKLKQHVCKPIIRLLDNVADGFSSIRNPKVTLMCMVLSIVLWMIQAASFYLLSLGCPGVTLGYMEIMAVMVLICFFIALPSVPGFWGLWEAGGVFALLLFGISAKEAAGFALVSHTLQLFPVILIGLISAWISGVNILQFAKQFAHQQEIRGDQLPPVSAQVEQGEQPCQSSKY